uniref:Protein kinase domain-containing protein n=1 Tax=Setaria viridis TaxID=4556 RepID=A0A4U6TNU6_SETVI|nr:cysteine-rich receptor-like protein kinase 10 [Setaria viridis]TKW02935.1 hypothetical protein SEVIR_7G029758v2 [Setaria viridis]
MDLAVLEHKNVVRCKGYCIEEKAILVYEDMPNRRLDIFINYFHLLPRNTRVELSLYWSSCFQVIKGIAKGVSYIHEKFMPWGDPFSGGLKPSDILMDSDWNPKIITIGISRVIEKSAEARAVQELVPMGYRAHEYVVSGEASVDSDVYSCGLIVLEIITGSSFSQEGQRTDFKSLIDHAWVWYKTLKEKELEDPILSCYLRRIRSCIKLATYCIKENPEDHPTMEVVLDFVNDRIVQEPAPT